MDLALTTHLDAEAFVMKQRKSRKATDCQYDTENNVVSPILWQDY